MSRRTLFALLAGLVFSGFTVLAHHSVAATYDTDKRITLHGAVTQVEWKNPHVFYFIDAVDDSGKVTNWAPPSRLLGDRQTSGVADHRCHLHCGRAAATFR